jgi:hypothetical protein
MHAFGGLSHRKTKLNYVSLESRQNGAGDLFSLENIIYFLNGKFNIYYKNLHIIVKCSINAAFDSETGTYSLVFRITIFDFKNHAI